MFGHLGASLLELSQYDEAAAAFEQAIVHNPQLADAHSGIAHVQWRLGLVDESIETLRTVLRIRPHVDFHSRCSFRCNSARETAESIYAEHRRFDEIHARPLASKIRPHENAREPERRLRIGYVSADFRDHVQALYTTPLFAAHDREQVEVFCYSHVQHADAVTDRIRARADVRERRA